MKQTNDKNRQENKLNAEILKINYTRIYEEYKRQFDRLKNMDTKANMILVFTGVLLTIFVNLMNNASDNDALFQITCLLKSASIVASFLSIVIAIFSFFPRPMSSLDISLYTDWKEYKVSTEEYYIISIKDYKDIVEDITVKASQKARYIQQATMLVSYNALNMLALIVIYFI